MFTGIIEGIGRLLAKRSSGGGLTFDVDAGFLLSHPTEGESIACNGVCLTAYRISGSRFCCDVSPETLSRTGLGSLAAGGKMNLERALRVSDRLGGHIVSGHVDCQAKLVRREPVGNYTLFTFSLPIDQMRYVIEKGSIAVDGVSLTVNSCEGGLFAVSVIPHTLQMTTLGDLHTGDQVNIELDLIGKYVERLLGGGSAANRQQQDISTVFLARHGYL